MVLLHRSEQKNFDILSRHGVEEVTSENKPSSISRVERLTIQPTLSLIQLVKQKVSDMTCSASFVPDTIHI
jgi:hypothetical protein